MNKKIIQFAIIFILISSCNNKNDTSAPVTKTDTVIANSAADTLTKTSITLPGDSTYAYIKKIIQKNDSVFIEADYIQFLTGKEAVEAAKKHHEADTMFDDKGKITDIIVDNDYYILNENKKLRTLSLSKNVMIETVEISNGPVSIVKTMLKDFISKHGADSFPFILKFKNNEVTEIQEVYLP